MKGPQPARPTALPCALLGAPVVVLALGLVCKPVSLEAAIDGPDSVVIKGWYLDTDPQWEMEADWAYGVPTGQGGGVLRSARSDFRRHREFRAGHESGWRPQR